MNKRKVENENEKEVKKEGIGKNNIINEIKKEKSKIDNKDISVFKKKQFKNEEVKSNILKD